MRRPPAAAGIALAAPARAEEPGRPTVIARASAAVEVTRSIAP